MTHVTLDPVRILALDLPAAARRLALSPGGRTLVLTDGLAADTLLLACWNLHADRADRPAETPRGALGLAQLAGGPAADLYPHPWREQAVVTAHEDGRGLLYGVDLSEALPLWRVVLDGPLLAALTPHPRGWLACEGPDRLNLFDLDGEEVMRVDLGAAPTSAPVLLPDGRIAIGAHRALLLLELDADPTPRRVDLPGTPRALALGPGGALAAALEDAVLLWPDGIEAPPFRAGVGPSQGPLVFSPRGALFVAHPGSGLFLIDPHRQLARRWAEGITCRALRLDQNGGLGELPPAAGGTQKPLSQHQISIEI
jgi:hypothetical protein